MPTLLEEIAKRVKEYKDDLFFIFVFNGSPLESLFSSNDDSISEMFEIIKSFNGYIGLSNTNYPLLKKQNEDVKKYIGGKIKWVPIHRCNYLNSEDYLIYETISFSPVTQAIS